MALRKAQPILWDPVGVSDAVDATNVFKGAMSALRDLVPDPSTSRIFVPRPAATQITDFTTSGIADPGFISALKVVGDIAYGMIATSSPAGKDVPFVYDLAAGSFVTISGITAGNTPNSAPATGTWIPPTIAVIGTKVVITHQGFTAGAPIGIIDVTTPASPSWTNINTSPTALPAKPIAVASFSGRAWYAGGNVVYFSDILLPDTITNASQSVTIGDDSNVTGFGTIPLSSLAGGSVESLMVFKPKTINQITGDIALSNLRNAEISTGIGTLSPLSIVSSPYGLLFISQHGLRNISQGGEISPVIGADGQGVSVPFINSVEPSRIVAGFSVNTYRVTTQNQFIPTIPYQDWWYNTDLKAWTGPHSFPASLVQPWEGTFVITPQGINASLWQSDIVPLDTSAYIENGNQLEFGYATVPMPLNSRMSQNAVIEASIGLQFSKVGGTVNFYAQDENTLLLDTASKSIVVSAAIWGTSPWGTGNWGGDVTNYQQVRIPWTKPIVFNQAVFGATGNAVSGFKIGTLSLRYQMLGYMVTP